jgi:hypothetical protein
MASAAAAAVGSSSSAAAAAAAAAAAVVTCTGDEGGEAMPRDCDVGGELSPVSCPAEDTLPPPSMLKERAAIGEARRLLGEHGGGEEESMHTSREIVSGTTENSEMRERISGDG